MWRATVSLFLTFALTAGCAQTSRATGLVQSYDTENQIYSLCSNAQLSARTNQWEQAKNLFLKAKAYGRSSYSDQIDRGLQTCFYNIASNYYNTGNYDKAIDAMNQYVAYGGDQATATQFIRGAGSYGYFRKGRAAYEADHYAEAKKWFRKAAEYDPSENSAAIHSHLAYVLHELGENGAAVEEGKKAIALDPKDSQVAYTIALSYEDLVNFDQASAWMNKYAAMEKNSGKQKEALQAASLMDQDRKKFNDPNNKQADYMDVMRERGEDLVRWPAKRLPLKVSIATATNVRGYKPSFNNLVKQAMDSWCEASGKRLDYKIISDASDADIRVGWTKDPLECDLDHPSLRVLGLTQLNGSANSGATDATVQISTVDPFDPNRQMPEGEVSAVVLHEIGHALGLGHSKMIKDCMYSRHAKIQVGLTKRDKATIARLYGEYPALAFVPKQTPVAAPTAPIAPPSFLPPPEPDDSNVVAPIFVPPPQDDEKFAPPVFTPPPPGSEKQVSAPLFIPTAPAPKKTTPAAPVKRKEQKSPSGPLFIPPPS